MYPLKLNFWVVFLVAICLIQRVAGKYISYIIAYFLCYGTIGCIDLREALN